VSERLPDFMVPSEFQMHATLPLTPQGKLNRAALIDLQTAKTAAPEVVTGANALEARLSQLWQSLLPAAKGSPADAKFAELGGDSLLAIKLMLGVEEITGQRVEISTFLVNPTIAGLCDAVQRRMSRSEFEPMLALRKNGTRPPIFCAYGFSGDVQAYFDLTAALGDDQPVYGIRSPALEDLSRLPQSMESAAAEVVGWIRKVQPQGPVALVGYSWAGVLTFEVARQLAAREGIHCYSALIGTVAPVPRAGFISRCIHFVRYFPLWCWRLMVDRKNRRRRLSRWRQMALRLNQGLVKEQLPLWETTPIARHMLGLMKKYRPYPISDITIDLFRGRAEFGNQTHPLNPWLKPHLPDAGWNRWTRRPNRILWIEGDHETIIKPPAVLELGRLIRQAMDAKINVATGSSAAAACSEPMPGRVHA